MKNGWTDAESKLKGHLLHQLLVIPTIHAYLNGHEINYLLSVIYKCMMYDVVVNFQ